MQVQLRDSLEFKINEIVLVTKGGNIDLSGLYAELSLYDSLFSPVCSGSMVIRDAIGLSSKIAFDGSESILIDITKNDDSEAAGLNYKKAFRVYKQSNRKNTGVNSEIYTLHFVSEELLLLKDIEKDLRVDRGARQEKYSITSTTLLFQNEVGIFSYSKTRYMFPDKFWT